MIVFVCRVVSTTLRKWGPAGPGCLRRTPGIGLSGGLGPAREQGKFHGIFVFVFHVTVTLCFHFKVRRSFFIRVCP